MGVSHKPEVGGAFDDAVVRLERSGRLYLRRHRLPPEDADDILQQTLLVFLIKQDEIYNPEAWLRGALRKRCLFYWRRRRKSLFTAVDASILEALAAPSAPDQTANDDVKRDLGRALESIPPRCRALLQLRYARDCDPQEAAAQLGYRPSGAYKIFERCLAALTRGLVATGFVKERPCDQ
ncbi:MAG TPA: sigma-70 family RNA polymerase sigma factor [Thermoanaerobaculia bacterium]|nr:sigma-70 family RNA polymerase sigma factor [Thermoanaerobaculia bacterium]